MEKKKWFPLLTFISVRTSDFFLDLSKEAESYQYFFMVPVILVVPCTPNIGTGVLDCFTNSALLDWMYSEGALNYTATALSPSGHVSTCTSNFTNCELPELHCGQMYNLTVVASDGQCSSPPSSSLQLDSGEFTPYDATPWSDMGRVRVLAFQYLPIHST